MLVIIIFVNFVSVLISHTMSVLIIYIFILMVILDLISSDLWYDCELLLSYHWKMMMVLNSCHKNFVLTFQRH